MKLFNFLITGLLLLPNLSFAAISDYESELLPAYCYAQSRVNPNIELELNLTSQKVYQAMGSPIIYSVNSIDEKQGGDYAKYIMGEVLNVFTAGMGTQTWELYLDGEDDTFTVFTESFHNVVIVDGKPNFTTVHVYDVVCD